MKSVKNKIAHSDDGIHLPVSYTLIGRVWGSMFVHIPDGIVGIPAYLELIITNEISKE